MFGINPPKRPITNLKTLVDDWIYRFGPKGISRQMRDEVVDHCIAARSYREAVDRACNSKRPNGKVHNHQSRVPAVVRMRFAENIHASKRAYDAKTFDEFYDILFDVAPAGIGPVTLYDVATRIAAYKDAHLRHCKGQHSVQSLYLHAGVRVGWCQLHGQRSPAQLRIPRDELPKELRRIPTDEVEDMLCAYRDVLQPWCANG